MPIELALTPDPRWPGTQREVVAAAAAAGFAAVGAWPDQVDDDLVEAYRAAGIRCHEVLALLVGSDDDATLASAQQLASAAEALGATWVLAVFLAPLDAGTDALVRRCAGALDEVGAGLAVEFSPLGPLTSIAAGLEVVGAARAGGGRAGVLIDTWHFTNGDSTWADLESIALDDIAYIQFDDALPPEAGRSPMAETLHRRALPGEGTFELERFATTLLGRGWEGTVSAEVFSAELRERPLGEIAGLVHEATARYWR